MAGVGRELGVRKNYLYQVWLVLLAAGGVARSLQILADMRLARALPAAKIPAPYLVYLFLPNALLKSEFIERQDYAAITRRAVEIRQWIQEARVP